VDISSSDELWTAIEESFKLVEEGTSPKGCEKLIADLKTFKHDLDSCLMKFNTLLNLLGAVADKYDIFKQEHSLAKECLSSLDKRRMGLSKSAPDSVQEWQSHCEQVKVRISCMSIQLLQ